MPVDVTRGFGCHGTTRRGNYGGGVGGSGAPAAPVAGTASDTSRFPDGRHPAVFFPCSLAVAANPPGCRSAASGFGSPNGGATTCRGGSQGAGC